MVLRRLHFDQKLKLNRTRMFIDRLIQALMVGVGFSLLVMLVTLCAPRPSGFTKLSNAPLTSTSSKPITDTPDNTIPVMAYYYIWFDPQSWDRAKTDYPLLGRYSSDDTD